MPNTTQLRVCAGMGLGHSITDGDVIGMVQVEGQTRLFCAKHSSNYEQSLRDLAQQKQETQLLEM